MRHISGYQSTLMRKCAAEQVLRKWLVILFDLPLEIYSLDDEVNMEAELNARKQFRIIIFKGSKGKLD